MSKTTLLLYLDTTNNIERFCFRCMRVHFQSLHLAFFIPIPHLILLIDLFQTKGGIISKIRRRLTVQGDSETLDGGALADLRESKAKAEEVRPTPHSPKTVLFASQLLIICLWN